MTCDVLIVGAGLAGVTLALHLERVGLSVLILDDPQLPSASSIAAGLVTPITGKRFVPSWRFDEFWPVAQSFYRSLENDWGCELLSVPSAIRVFQSPAEATQFTTRQQNLSESAGTSQGLLNGLASPFGYFTMPNGARLNIPQFLSESRNRLSIVKSSFDFERDATYSEGFWHIDPNIQTKDLVLCQGDFARVQGPFQQLPFLCAKGEILRLHIPDLVAESRIIHSGIWLVKDTGDEFLCGSTYEWKQLDWVPTQVGREKLLEQVRRLVQVPFEVIDHKAGVRPVIDLQRPVVGWHPKYPRLGILNGLGSKGSLLAPYFAEHFAKCWNTPENLDPEVNVRRYPL